MVQASRPPRSVYGKQGRLLYFLPLPLAIKAITALWWDDVAGLLAAAAAFALLLGGAWLARLGMASEQAGRPPTTILPLKPLGAALVALGTLVTAWLAAGYSLPIAAVFAAGALLGFHLRYGLISDRGRPLRGDLADVLRAAYAKLDQITALSRQIHVREFHDRLDRIVDWSEKILGTIADHPEDWRRARKFLNVYLDGVREVTEKYARTQPRSGSLELEDNFRSLLDDMERVSREQYQMLLADDVVDLDVQIEVLSTRMKREGVV